MLEAALEQAFARHAQVVGIVGEAGVGKSRLCDEFMRRCRARGIPVYQTSGQAHAKSIPLLPVLEIMRAYFGISDQDAGQTARERIAGKLLLLDESFGEDLPLIFDFLGVPDPERPSPRIDPEEHQRRLLALTKRLVRAQSARDPGVTLFEDLHWLDPATEVFLANHVEAAQGTRGLMLAQLPARVPGAVDVEVLLPPDPAGAARPRGARRNCSTTCSAGPVARRAADLVRERTAGNPFFTEEVVRSLVEAGTSRGARRRTGSCESVDTRGAGERAGRARGAHRPARRSARRRCCRRPP